MVREVVEEREERVKAEIYQSVLKTLEKCLDDASETAA